MRNTYVRQTGCGINFDFFFLWKNTFNVKYLENGVRYIYWQNFWCNAMVLGVNQSQEDISGCRGLRNVAMATKFWPK